MRNIALIIQYLGTNYSGWQSQNNAKSIQDAVEDALSKILGHRAKLYGSGRTDAGVHAARQVANFFTENKIAVYKLPLGVNLLLPEDISVTEAFDVDDSFNARSSAKSKTYVYRYYVSPARFPLLELNHTQIYSLPDISAMRAAAEFLIGKKDFKNFSSTGSNVNSTIREIYSCAVRFFPQRNLLFDAMPEYGNGFNLSLAGRSELNEESRLSESTTMLPFHSERNTVVFSGKDHSFSPCWERYSDNESFEDRCRLSAGQALNGKHYSLFQSVTVNGGQIQDGRGGIVTIEVCGNAFLYNMVRIIAGVLLAAGRGLIHPQDVGDIFLKGRPKCVKTAPAKGLTLEKVDY